jgi:hypothetical protein
MHLPVPGRRLRWLSLGYGGVLFVWLALEDVSVWPVTLIGSGLAVLICLLWALNKIGGQRLAVRWVPPLFASLGLVMGLGSSILVVALMFFKNARHSHIFPDYPPAMMLAMLQRAPLWAAAGGLVGLSLGLGWLAVHRERDE